MPDDASKFRESHGFRERLCTISRAIERAFLRVSSGFIRIPNPSSFAKSGPFISRVIVAVITCLSFNVAETNAVFSQLRRASRFYPSKNQARQLVVPPEYRRPVQTACFNPSCSRFLHQIILNSTFIPLVLFICQEDRRILFLIPQNLPKIFPSG